jgi:hypothetical protein
MTILERVPRGNLGFGRQTWEGVSPQAAATDRERQCEEATGHRLTIKDSVIECLSCGAEWKNFIRKEEVA